jgi:undecaprenyl-phosphate 4-deoxy-4-formamido-L-arabinose transferase
MKRPSVSVVIPVYRSEQTLPTLLARLAEVLAAHARCYEVICVNDDSRDGSGEVLDQAARRYSWVRVVHLMRNYGQHNALLCGVRLARFEITVTMDDDLQHPPEEIPTLLEGLRDDVDVVYGTPEVEQHGFWRDIASRITKIALQSSMGSRTARRVSAFRAFRTQARDAFATYSAPFVSLDVLLTWASTRFSAVTVRHEPRRIGSSNYTFGKLVIHALNMMTGFSTWPLQVASLVGIAFTFFGFLVLCFVVGRYVVAGTTVPGFPLLASLISIFSGAQMFALGVMGEYLARMHFRTMERPAYTIRVDPRRGGSGDGSEDHVAPIEIPATAQQP